MKTILHTVQDVQTYSADSGTAVIKLPRAGLLHTLFVKLRAVNGATTGFNQTLRNVVSKIEVIANGSEVIKSLSVFDLERIAYRVNSKFVPEVRTEVPSAEQSVTLPIFFGRWTKDNEYFLPTSNLSDLELRITYALSVGASNFASGSFGIGVYALRTLEDTPGGYRGTVVDRLIKQFTTAASGQEQTFLPRGKNLLGVQVYAGGNGIDAHNAITNVILRANGGETYFYNQSFKSLAEANAIDFWLNDVYSYLAHCGDGDILYTTLSPLISYHVDYQGASGTTPVTGYMRKVASVSGDALTIAGLSLTDTAGTSGVAVDATKRLSVVQIKSVGLPSAVYLDTANFGVEYGLDTKRYDSIELMLTQSVANANVNIAICEIDVF